MCRPRWPSSSVQFGLKNLQVNCYRRGFFLRLALCHRTYVPYLPLIVAWELKVIPSFHKLCYGFMRSNYVSCFSMRQSWVCLCFMDSIYVASFSAIYFRLSILYFEGYLMMFSISWLSNCRRHNDTGTLGIWKDVLFLATVIEFTKRTERKNGALSQSRCNNLYNYKMLNIRGLYLAVVRRLAVQS
jgi:hypothetical protein